MTRSHSDQIVHAQASLRAAQDSIRDEISAYPTPISGCDAQLNHLLSERAKVAEALRALSGTPFVATPRALKPKTGVESR